MRDSVCMLVAHVCMYVYVCMYVCIYIYTYIHTYIHRDSVCMLVALGALALVCKRPFVNAVCESERVTYVCMYVCIYVCVCVCV